MKTGSVLRSFAVAMVAAVPLILLPVAAQSAQAAVPGQLTITNPDLIPGNDSVIFNRIQQPADVYERMHQKVALRMTNTGDTDLVVNSATAAPNYKWTSTSSRPLPATLTKGQYIDVTVNFIVTYGAWHTGTLVVNSTPAGGATTGATVKLAGYWQRLSENGLEPTVQAMVSNFGYGTAMPTSMYNRGAYQAFSADEVLSPYWTAANAAQPVGLTQLAGFRGYPTGTAVQTYQKGAPTTLRTVFTGLRDDAQSILPRASSWAPGRTSFTTTGTFGIKFDDAYSDPTLNNQAPGRAAGCTATNCGQYLRVFQARTAAGALIPGTYIMTMDYNGGNYDFNDNVYLLTNLTPAV